MIQVKHTCFLHLQCKCANHGKYQHGSQELFQAAQRDDAETVGRIVVKLERNGYQLQRTRANRKRGQFIALYAA